MTSTVCDVLFDLVPFLQFEKREKRPWRCVTFVFHVFKNFTNVTKSRKISHDYPCHLRFKFKKNKGGGYLKEEGHIYDFS